ncbi:MAG: NDP-hexose 2,3-dehydratase family protein [Actinomycetota bacterium]|nr:NDP-hexose 2,3-dehydratase family protein [Actinomycetota bacterium]
MTDVFEASFGLVPVLDTGIAARIADSALAFSGGRNDSAAFDAWLADARTRFRAHTEVVPLDRLSGWSVNPVSGDIGHDSGKFFTVRGLDVEVPGAAIERWSQPIIIQPEVGILGILVKQFDGVLHCLMQAKVEPGNVNGVQLSPTVQATRSNYTSVHRGKAVPYLEYFRQTGKHTVIADVRQSEQGAWFHLKRNRNMVVEVAEDVELLDGFCWLTLGQVNELLRVDDLINMDTRTVLGCFPVAGASMSGAYKTGEDSDFRAALVRSCSTEEPAVHTIGEILSWITDARTRQDLQVREIPLKTVRDWHWVDGRISHETGMFFDVVGVRVEAEGREVGRWQQPMFEPRGEGLVALFVREFDGVLHALMHARVEAGYLDVLELAPTVQCTPETYDRLAADARPPFLDAALTAEDIHFDAVHSEEGGRFMHARTRYMVVPTNLDADPVEHPNYRWMTLHQLGTLLRHSHYLNVQARSILACLHSLAGGQAPRDGSLASRYLTRP